MKYGLALLLLGVLSAPAGAQQADMPAPLRRGLELWRADSADAAARAWSAAWTGPTDAGKTDQLRQVLAQFAALGGSTRGYEVLGVDSVGAHLRRFYAVLRYERIPVFAQFVAYDPGASAPAWMVLSVRLHTEAQQVLPPAMWPR